jgi:hypothetical protein
MDWMSTLRARGVTSLDDLTHDQQRAIADRVGIDVPEMHRAWAANGQLRRVQQQTGRQSTPRTQRGAALAAEREREIVELRTRPGEDLLAEMLGDEKVWGEITRAARAINVPVIGTRSATYGHVTRSLAQLRQRWLNHDEQVSDQDNQWVQRTLRRIRDAESSYCEAALARSEALVGLERQAAAVLGAARMSGRAA